MKKLLLLVTSMILLFAAAQDPNRLILTGKDGIQKIFNLENVEEITFANVADASVELSVDSIGETSVWLSSEMSDECKSFKVAILTAEEAAQFTKDRDLAQYIDTVADTTYTQDIEALEFKEFDLTSSLEYVIAAVAYDENNIKGLVNRNEVEFEAPIVVVPALEIKIDTIVAAVDSAVVTFTTDNDTCKFHAQAFVADSLDKFYTNNVLDTAAVVTYLATLECDNELKGYTVACTFKGLTHSTEYTVLAWECRDDFENITAANFTTLRLPEMAIEVDTIVAAVDSAVVTFTTDMATRAFHAQAFVADSLAKFYTNNVLDTAAVVTYLATLECDNELEGDTVACTFKGLTHSTEYTVLAWECRDDFENITAANFTTLRLPDLAITLGAVTKTHKSASVAITTNDTTRNYFVELFAKADLADYFDANGVLDTLDLLAHVDTLKGLEPLVGNITVDFDSLAATTDYVIVAWEDREDAEVLSFTAFKTNNVPFTLKGQTITHNSATFTVTPYPSTDWYYQVMTKADYEAGVESPAALAYDTLYAIKEELYPDASFYNYLYNKLGYYTTKQFTVKNLEKNTDYVLCLFFINVKAENRDEFAASDIEVFDFKTLAEAPALEVTFGTVTATENSVSVTITPSNDEAAYFTLIDEKADLAACYVDGEFNEEKALEYVATVPGLESRKKGFTLETSGLTASTDYVILVWEDREDVATIDFVEFTTTAPRVDFTYSNVTATHNSISFTATPNDLYTYWAYTVLTKAEYDNGTNPIAKVYSQYINEYYYSDEYYEYGYSYGQYLVSKFNSRTGEKDVVATGLQANTDYVVCTFFINYYASNSTDFGTYTHYDTYSIKTTEVPALNIAFGEPTISDNNISVTMTPSINNVNYYARIIAKADLASCYDTNGTLDTDAALTYVQSLTDNNAWTWVNTNTFTLWEATLTAGTEYVLVAWAMESASALSYLEFTTTGTATPDEPGSGTIEMTGTEFTVSNGSADETSMTCTVTPLKKYGPNSFMKGDYWYYYVMTKADYTNANNNPTSIIKSEIEALWRASAPSTYFGEWLAANGGKTGAQTVTATNLSSNTEYVMFIYYYNAFNQSEFEIWASETLYFTTAGGGTTPDEPAVDPAIVDFTYSAITKGDTGAPYFDPIYNVTVNVKLQGNITNATIDVYKRNYSGSTTSTKYATVTLTETQITEALSATGCNITITNISGSAGIYGSWAGNGAVFKLTAGELTDEFAIDANTFYAAE